MNSLTILVLIYVFAKGCECDTNFTQHTRQLRRELLVTKDYDRHARPVKSHTTITKVFLYLYIEQLVDVDTSKGTVMIDAMMSLEWWDEYLVWDPAKHNGVKWLSFDSTEIWKPDVAAADSDISGQISYSTIRVNASGLAIWVKTISLTSNCEFDLSNFPFDQEHCDIWISTWSYGSNDVNITFNNRETCVYGPTFINQQWSISDITCTRHDVIYDVDGDWSYIHISFLVTRHLNNYKYFLQLPYVSASLFAIVAFLFPIGSNQRFLFAAFSLLLLISLLVFIGSSLGFQSLGAPYAVRCISVNMFLVILFLALSTLFSQMLIRSHRYFPSLPRLMIISINNPILLRVLFVSSGKKEEKVGVEKPNDDDENGQFPDPETNNNSINNWILMSKIVDRLFFIVYVLTIIIYHT